MSWINVSSFHKASAAHIAFYMLWQDKVNAHWLCEEWRMSLALLLSPERSPSALGVAVLGPCAEELHAHPLTIDSIL